MPALALSVGLSCAETDEAADAPGSTSSPGSGTGRADSATTALGPSSTATGSDPGSSSSEPSDSSSEGAEWVGTEDGSTGQSPGLCGLTERGDTPWFELLAADAEAPLAESGELFLTCGGQGSWMFVVKLELGGFEPEGNDADFSVTLDVPGYDLGPGGHFFSSEHYEVFIGCGPTAGIFANNQLLLVTPDELLDVMALEGQQGTLTVVLNEGGGTSPQVVAVTLRAVDDGSWKFCAGGKG